MTDASAQNTGTPALSKFYLSVVLAFMAVFPIASILIEMPVTHVPASFALAGKWFIFWGAGLRLFTAGLRQITKPGFTAKEIFHIDHEPSNALVRELGFANVCFGAVGIISLFLPGWRVVSAFASGMYYGLAGVMHIIKKPAGPNEVVAMVSDFFIFFVLAAYVVLMF